MTTKERLEAYFQLLESDPNKAKDFLTGAETAKDDRFQALVELESAFVEGLDAHLTPFETHLRQLENAAEMCDVCATAFSTVSKMVRDLARAAAAL